MQQQGLIAERAPIVGDGVLHTEIDLHRRDGLSLLTEELGEIIVNVAVVRHQLGGLAQHHLGLRGLELAHKAEPEIAEDLRIVRRGGTGFAQLALGFRQPAAASEKVTEISMRVGKSRRAGDGLAIGGFGFRIAARRAVGRAEVRHRIRAVAAFRRFLEQLDGALYVAAPISPARCALQRFDSLLAVHIAQPQALVHALELGGETARIAERGRGHARAKSGAQGGERFDIGRAGDSLGDVFLTRDRDPVREAQRAHDGGAEAADGGPRLEADGRHAEPGRFDGGGAAVVRERIERDVDGAVSFPCLGLWRREDEVDAICRNAVAGKEVSVAAADLLVDECHGVEHEARPRHPLQDLAPGGDDLVVEAYRAAEVAEGDIAVGERGQRRDVRHTLRRLIGHRHAGQALDGLGEKVIGARRGQLVVRQERIHHREAGRISMPQEMRDLHGRGLAGESEQAVARRMTAEIDQHVDGIAANEIGQLVVRQSDCAAPMLRERLQAMRFGVGGRYFRIAEDLDLAAVMPHQDRLDEVARGLGGEIGGDVADAQPSARRPVIRPDAVLGRVTIGVHLAPAAELREDLIAGEARVIGHREQHHAVALGMAGRFRERCLENLDGFGDTPLILKRVGQIEADLSQIRSKREGLAQIALGGDELAAAHEDERAVVEGLGVIGLGRDRLAEGILCLAQSLLGGKSVAERIVGCGVPGLCFEDSACGRFRIGEAPKAALDIGEIAAAVDVRRIFGQMLDDAGRRIGETSGGLEASDLTGGRGAALENGLAVRLRRLGSRFPAPFFPEFTECGLEVPGEAGAVGERRGFHARPQARSQRRQRRDVGRLRSRQSHVRRDVSRNPVAKAHRAQVARPEPANRRTVRNRHNRNTQPQRLDRRRPRIVRERIQRDVHFSVRRPRFGLWARVNKHKPIPAHSVHREPRRHQIRERSL